MTILNSPQMKRTHRLLVSNKASKIAVIASLLALSLLNACSSNDGGSDDVDTSGDNGNIENPTNAGSGNNNNFDNGNNTTVDNAQSTAFVLEPLPNPPLTEAPSADDDPIAESALFNTITNFALVRDPGARIAKPETISSMFTDADFEAGLLPPEIVVPIDVDPTTNTAPDFENLNNIDAVAGELVEIVFKPFDVDGDLPGMFPIELPPGGSFDDNFDGSKTYRWQPLQNDVGINAFSVTAIDPLNSQYRNTRTILIRVSLPEDESTIPNVAPTLDPFVLHTVRQNDPVVMELKGIDLNGTLATLELVTDDLTQASFTQHPRFEEIFTLRFVADTVGLTDIEILVRDSIDTNLSTTETVTLNVLPAAAFAQSGSRLKDLAAAQGIQFGYASLPEFYHRPDGAIYAATAANEFNLVSPENSMKMELVNPAAGRYQFADMDNLVTFANQNNIDIHAHPLIWHRQLPAWIQNVSVSELEGHMREYIARLLTRYQNNIQLWDIINEPIGDNGGFRDSIWYQAMGEQYLDIAFHQAREIAPSATLLLNDFDIAFNGPKADTLFTMVDGLIEREVPIDGVGFQMHFFNEFNRFDEVRDNFARIAERGLDIYITELDVSLSGNNDFELQADVYRQIVEICVDQPRCRAIQTWGFTDQYSFREIFEPLMFDKSYQAKPAYTAIQEALSN